MKNDEGFNFGSLKIRKFAMAEIYFFEFLKIKSFSFFILLQKHKSLTAVT